MKPEKNFDRYRLFGEPLLILFFVFASGLFFIKPKAIFGWQAWRQLGVKRESLAQLTAKAAALEGLDKTELGRKIDRLEEALPAEKNPAYCLFFFRSLAQEADLKVISLQAEPGELVVDPLSQAAQAMTFALRLGGAQEKILSFLDQSKTSLPLFGFSQVKIETNEEEGYEADLMISSFFQPFSQIVFGPETPLSLLSGSEENAYQRLSRFKKVVLEEPTLTPGGRQNPFRL